jgi:hypothetical protein
MRKDYYDKYRPIGFTFCADAYCYDCGADLPEIDQEGNAKGVVMPWDVLTYDENDMPCPYPCDKCGEPIVGGDTNNNKERERK